MSIRPLPQETIRLLSSSVKLTNPCDVLKELVDNAIDAEATSIDVVVSANTLDKIVVRGNGHGIPLEDLDLLGRRGHTSKLRSFEELQHKGGETLGFRGDALASVNSIATVVITTKTSGEPVATRIQLRHGIGGVVDRKPVSGPVGTTVQASELFKTIPARRHLLLHGTQKTFSGMRDLLSAYVIARPRLRVSLKVAGHDSSFFSYAPSGAGSVREAALQLFGKALVANCTPISLHHEASGFALDALLPSRDCDVKALKGKAFHVSVDRRPLSPSGELPKLLYKQLKSHISRSLATTNLPTLFMQLNITCPRGSYDPNVSSLKDEVLFANQQEVLELFEELCQAVYGIKESSDGEEGRTDAASQAPVSSSPDSDGGNQSLDDLAPLDDCDVLQMFEDMERAEMLDHLDEEAKAGGTSTNAQTDTAESPKETDTRLIVDAPSAKETSVKVRTVFRVDMSRNDSNATDDAALADMVDVTLPAELPKQTSCDSSSAQSRRRGDIRRYFQKNSDREFQIACDETAAGPATVEAESPHRVNWIYGENSLSLTLTDISYIGGIKSILVQMIHPD
ncbi:hypothetical protein PLIIFM63780_007131 [Purpureocillium lilacinum]|uniref:DNA mismatch repair protein n=2 Tax=Purpureocillium lilacinum TaxID=33203 RepID=A0A179GUX3_PURLI|nr:DNA mismatch repair protein [Purpureocillium lilacinum]GJN73066.1 hypothetical protein PLICBS_007142 [Purpureocillium lilacinum]GJN83582.1 hypothetical protein PLIIFM63780_007131 [Purpureocillium lilacinum]